MRSVGVDLVRARKAERRCGVALQLTLGTLMAAQLPATEHEVLCMHLALENLAAMDARLVQVVEMRYSGGLMEAEIAQDWQKERLRRATLLDGRAASTASAGRN